MTVYLMNIIFLFLGYFILINQKKINGRAWFCAQASIQWILISGLRSTAVGADTGRYELIFNQVKEMEWQYIWSLVKQSWSLNAEIKDSGYYLLQKVFQLFSTDYNVYLTFVAVLFFVPMAIWIYKYSENVLLSYITFSCLFYSFFAITGTRQTIVTGIGVFIGLELLHRKKYFLYYLMIFLLFPIHKSVITLAIFPVVYRLRVTNKKVIGWIALIGACWIFRGRLMTFLSVLVGYEQYDQMIEGAGANTFVTLFMVILVIGLYIKNYILKTYDISVEVYNAMLVAACLLPLTAINQSAMRVVQYFSIYLVLFLPWVVKIVRKKQQFIAIIVGELLMIYLLIRNNPVYTFFWENIL